MSGATEAFFHVRIACLFLGGWYPLPFGGWFGIDINTHWYLPPAVFIGIL